MDQLLGSGKHADGASGGEGSLCDRFAASEVAGAAARGRGSKRWSQRNRTRTARIFGGVVRQLATAGRFRLRRSNPAHQRRQVQKDCAPRTARRVEMENMNYVR